MKVTPDFLKGLECARTTALEVASSLEAKGAGKIAVVGAKTVADTLHKVTERLKS